MTKLIVAFRNFGGNAPKNGKQPTTHSEGEMRYTREENEILNDGIKITTRLLNPLFLLLPHVTSQPQMKCRYSWRLRLKYDGTRAETRFRLSVKRTSPFKSAGPSVQSSTGSRGVRINGSNAGYNMFRGSVKSTG
jgi:hypothetical protein